MLLIFFFAFRSILVVIADPAGLVEFIAYINAFIVVIIGIYFSLEGIRPCGSICIVIPDSDRFAVFGLESRIGVVCRRIRHIISKCVRCTAGEIRLALQQIAYADGSDGTGRAHKNAGINAVIFDFRQFND